MIGGMYSMRRILFLSIIAGLLLMCAAGSRVFAAPKGGKPMEIKSSAFEQGGMIPPKFTCEGNNISPSITWEGAPEGTRSIALIADDPDAPMGTWVHWVYYDIPMKISHLSEGIPQENKPASGGTQGVNDFQNVGYDGPCPPSGTHRYFFKIYALDTMLNLKPGAGKKELLKAMEGHILGEGALMGRFTK